MSSTFAPAAAAAASSYWCYRCSRFVRASGGDALACPSCDGGFLEEVDTHPRIHPAPRRFPIPATVEARYHRGRRPSGGAGPGADRASAFNPVIVLRSPSQSGNADPNGRQPASFELYYDDGAGSGLRPLPTTMSEFLMGSGFDRLLEQLSQIGINGAGGGTRGYEQPPASKAAVESMPTVKISSEHVKMESHCAVCKDLFELETEAREMPCKHIYHEDCILPWLALHNSCPVCRHQMPVDARRIGVEPEAEGEEVASAAGGGGGEEDAIGMTIWRLPGGGFAVGRFSGGMRAAERELPVVYTEMDGGFNSGGVPRRISWNHRGSRSRESRGIAGAFRNFFSAFGCFCGSPASSSSSSRSRRQPEPSSSRRSWRAPILDGSRRRHRDRNWELEGGNGNEIARW